MIVPLPFGVHDIVFASVFTHVAGFGLLADSTVIAEPELVAVKAELTFMLQFEFGPQLPFQLPAFAKVMPFDDELSTVAVIANPDPLPDDPEPEPPLPDDPEPPLPDEPLLLPLLLLDEPDHADENSCNCTPARL